MALWLWASGRQLGKINAFGNNGGYGQDGGSLGKLRSWLLDSLRRVPRNCRKEFRPSMSTQQGALLQLPPSQTILVQLP